MCRDCHSTMCRDCNTFVVLVAWFIGVKDWRDVASNETAQAIIEAAHAEASLLRGFVRSANEFYVLANSSPSSSVWSGYQLHRTNEGDGYAMLFRRCEAVEPSFAARLFGLD